MLSILTLMLTVWCVHLEHASAASSRNLTHLLLERMLLQADTDQNFVVAPQVLRTLYETQYAGKITSEQNQDDITASTQIPPDAIDDFDGSLFNPNPNPTTTATSSNNAGENAIIVSNTLHELETNETATALTNSSAPAGRQLINVVAMKSRWAHNFHKRDTHKRLFYNTPHSHVYIEFMRKDDVFRYARMTDLNASAVELSLQGNELRLLLLLPHSQDGLGRLQQRLGANLQLLDEIIERRLRATLVRLFLPKFKYEHRLHVEQLFEQLGHETKARPVGVAQSVVQETHIEVSENGIGDLERTMVLFWNSYSSLRTIPEKLAVEHPFIFIIRNKMGIQFIGHVAQLMSHE